MTTPTMMITSMITSMITTATTVITGMVVIPALLGEVVGLGLMLTGAVAPSLWEEVVGLVLMLTGAVAVEVAHNVKNAQNERVDTRESPLWDHLRGNID